MNNLLPHLLDAEDPSAKKRRLEEEESVDAKLLRLEQEHQSYPHIYGAVEEDLLAQAYKQ